MKTRLYFRPNIRCKCVVLQEGGSWAGCRGARCRGARDGHPRLWYQGRRHHPLNQKFSLVWQTYGHLGVFNLSSLAALEKKVLCYTTYLHICTMYQVSGIRYHYLTWEAVSHWLLQGLPQKKAEQNKTTKQNE